MEFTVSAARWVVGRALGPVTGELMEAWAASKKLGPNIRELKLLLLHAQAMLENAEGRDIRNGALDQLLSQLRDLAYDADDVLDELDYFRIQDELDGTYEAVDDAEEERGLVRGLALHARHTARAIARKLKCTCSASARSHADAEEGRCLPATAVGKLLPCCSPPTVHNDDAAGAKTNEQHLQAPKLKFVRVEMSKKMSEIVEQLKPVCDAVDRILGPLQPSGHSKNAKTQCIDLEKRPKTTPTIIEHELFGRKDLKRIVADEIMIGKYRDNDITVLPIVGPGGIGKTTFTQHIYEEVKNHFQISVWICVSQNFNANVLAKEIVEKMPKGNNEKENESDQEKIEKRIQSQQFLLVLDDVWEYHEDEWKTLLAPFRKSGTKGNMVIVTTRKQKIAKMVESTDCSIKLDRLDHEDSMRLFQACVFDNNKTWEDYPSGLQKVGVDIVDRLKGFPLAIKTGHPMMLEMCCVTFQNLYIFEHYGELGFPRDMGNLLKLRHFLVHDDNIHSSIFEVGKLNFLHELRKFEVKREMKGFDLEQIGRLLVLRGSLGIYNLEKVEGIKEANDAKLAYLNHLDSLVLDWDNERCNRDPIREGNVLENLKPHDNIRELHIAGHGGVSCPNWLSGDLSIRNLESLLIKYVNWDTFPLPGKLYMTEGQERQGSVTSHDFHNLKRLELVNIQKLKRWHGDGVDSGLEMLNYSKDESSLYITGKDAPGSMFWNMLDFNNLTELQEMNITKCPPISLDHLKMLTCLKTLQITDSGSILLPVDCENYVQYNLPVEKLIIRSCERSKARCGGAANNNNS
ncbi:disease resistance protein RGA2 [Oryza sativa Japonica Group]|uniref:disease resistance protein RGA2 n=1 Tax=Oryza sativa subsp. japonica TaxID=39947 RepID=UPI000E1C243F|nr:disease resistance protein RGA2-like [Oryza sativa Japonica Group]XP_025877582.1 disease resistance protein RGA2-like [Oryza sativa Japonica Group]